MPLSEIVSVQIDRQTKFPTQVGFGTPLIMGTSSVIGAEKVRTYTDIDGVAEDFTTSDNEYKAASAIFSQSPRPEQIKVGKIDAKIAAVKRVTPVAVNTFTYVVTINGVEFQFISDASATVAEITAGLTTAINAGSEPVTAADVTTHITLTADVAGLDFSLQVGSNLTALVTTPNTGIETALTDIEELGTDFYAIISTSRAPEDVKGAAQWAEPRVKLFFFAEDDAGILDPASTTDIFYFLKAKNYDRTVMLFSEDQENYPEAAWVGQNLPKDPGSITWKFKNLNGVVADVLTSTEKAAAKGKNGNVYTTIAGISMTEEGVVASGEFIDIIQGSDWLSVRIQEEVFAALVNEPKIPYTNAGVDAIKNQVLRILTQGVLRGILRPDPAPEVTAPLVADIALADRANRLLPDVEFTGQFAGAIHKVEIQGTISV